MNKQELINELKRISLEKQHEALTHPESKNYYEGMVMAYSQVVHMVNTVLKLDEPKKPVVPKFVAEWIEYAKKKGCSLAISFKPWNLYGVEYSKADRWIEDNQETFARAWIDGYEVEKEPLYRVKIGEGYFVEYQERGALIMPDDNKEIKMFDSKSDAERTAQTIGGTVEEVAEG
ncbi:DUF1642 domain-containing protein [Enterococcus faecium]|nr:DUF1642 domain-containing protein [Enterococcus faecium]